MNRDQISKESKYWVEDHIITETQRDQLLERYPERQNRPVLLTFAAIFIGLGFLTFIASNWSEVTDLVQMGIIVSSLLGFYLSGEWVFRKHSKVVGLSLVLVALLIFGAGIFLTGQMYHYTSYSAFPFFIWALAGFSLCLLFKDRTFFTATVVIVTVGQIYSGLIYQDFHPWMGLLFVIGIGSITYREKNNFSSLLFGISYVIQSLVFVFSEELPYYWLISLFLILYLLDDLIVDKSRIRSFKTLSILAIIGLNTVQVFLLEHGYVFERFEQSFYFFIVWAVLFVYAVIRSAMSTDNYYWIDLILFVPVFRFGMGDNLSLVILFLYALLWLLAGYKQEVYRWVNKGSVIFLFTTLVAYFQLAWDFMNRSLFFFVGGVLLFLLSFFLERKRRQFHQGGDRS